MVELSQEDEQHNKNEVTLNQTSHRNEVSSTTSEKKIASKKHPRDTLSKLNTSEASESSNKRIRVDVNEHGANTIHGDASMFDASNATRENQPSSTTEKPELELGQNGDRLRYTIEQLLSMKHKDRMVSLNCFPFSKHAVEQVFEVSATQDMVLDPNGHLRTSDVLVDVAKSECIPTFAGMQLPAPIVKGLKSAGFERPSPVQLRGIPVARLGIDIIAQAKSGTGKTLVFTTTVVELALAAAPGCVCAVVLVPTREIARQIGNVVINVLGGTYEKASNGVKEKKSTATKNSAKEESKKPSNCSHVAILVGGHPEHLDVSRLKSATVVVGTPARVQALITKGIFEPKAVQLLVLDEADRLLDGGAGFEMSKVVSLLPSRRQSMAFSATYTPALVACLRGLMRKPHLVWLGEQGIENEMDMCQSAVLRGVGQWRANVGKNEDKYKVLMRILKGEKFNAAIVFVRKRDMAKEVSKKLRKMGTTSKHVTAALSNAQRRDALSSFSKGKVKVMVCTDMLSRGVSFDVCDLVIHMDVPREVSTYLHRVGRAGRFGCEGLSVMIVCKAQHNDLAAIETRIGKIKVWSENVRCKNQVDEEKREELDVVDKSDKKSQPAKEKKVAVKEVVNHEIVEEIKKMEEQSPNENDFGRGFEDGYLAAQRMISRIEAYRDSRYSEVATNR